MKNLTASPQEEAITLVWSKPYEYKEVYRFNLTWQRSQGPSSVVINSTEYTFTDLAPGTEYNFSVTTETLDGTQAASSQISKYTSMTHHVPCCSLIYYNSIGIYQF